MMIDMNHAAKIGKQSKHEIASSLPLQTFSIEAYNPIAINLSHNDENHFQQLRVLQQTSR